MGQGGGYGFDQSPSFCELKPARGCQKRNWTISILLTSVSNPYTYITYVHNLDTNFKWSLLSKTHCDSLVCDALSEMSGYADTGEDCWLSRVRKLDSLFNIPSLRNNLKKEVAGNTIKKRVKSVFDRFWLDEINAVKIEKWSQFKQIVLLFNPEKLIFKRTIFWPGAI